MRMLLNGLWTFFLIQHVDSFLSYKSIIASPISYHHAQNKKKSCGNRKNRMDLLTRKNMNPFPSISINNFSSKPNSKIPIKIQKVNIPNTDTITISSSNDLLDVASFRNNCTSPTQMIERQKIKRESVQTSPMDSIIQGMSVGLFMGTIVFGVTLLLNDNSSILESVQSFAAVSIIVGTMISINNLTGNRVYVYTEAEAINRLMVDFVSMVKAGDDVGFIARLSSSSTNQYDKYTGTNGVVGAIDCQLRNSQMTDISYCSSKKYGNLPPHFHMKNMLVDDGMRRQGVGSQLIQYVETFAKTNTDAKLLTLEVDESNVGAVNLYQRFGFIITNTNSSSGYNAFIPGRIFMTKEL